MSLLMSPNIPSGNRALLKLIFSGGVPKYADGSGRIEGDAVTLEANATEANFSNKKLGVPGAVIIAAWLSSGKDKGALLTFTFSGDYSSEPVTMETTMTEADFSGKRLGASGGMMVAAFLPKCQ
jgi:hypothetical protein